MESRAARTRLLGTGGPHCQVEATGVRGRARGVCSVHLLRDNVLWYDLPSDNTLPRYAVACNFSILTSSDSTED